MTRSPAKVLTEWLTQYGAGSIVSGWPITTSLMNDSPNNCISVHDTHPDFDGRNIDTGKVTEHPGIMILVRSALYPDGYAKARDICNALAAMIPNPPDCEHLQIDSDLYKLYSFKRTNGPNPLANKAVEEKNARRLFSINGYFTYEDLS